MFYENPNKGFKSWHQRRCFWALFFVLPLLGNFVAHSLMQGWLYMRPCEYCIYLRVVMFAIALFALLPLINPKVLLFKILAFAGIGFSLFKGLTFSFFLLRFHEALTTRNLDLLDGLPVCSMNPHFPLDLPLNEWAPSWFQPTGWCGSEFPQVPVDVILSSSQTFIINQITEAGSFYLVPAWELFSLAEIAFIFLVLLLFFLLLLIMSLLKFHFSNIK